MYGRREKRGREGGVKRENYAALRNISQSRKKCNEAGANIYRARTGIKGYGKQEA